MLITGYGILLAFYYRLNALNYQKNGTLSEEVFSLKN